MQSPIDHEFHALCQDCASGMGRGGSSAATSRARALTGAERREILGRAGRVLDHGRATSTLPYAALTDSAREIRTGPYAPVEDHGVRPSALARVLARR
jgi:hypothetical protein